MPQSIEYISTNGSNVFVASNTTDYISIAVDYRAVLSNIANSLFTISGGIQTINSNLANITSEIQNSNSTLSIISDDINIIRVLGNTGGVGYKTTTPFGWIGQSALYQLYVEQGYALSNSYVVDAATQTAALDRLKLSAQNMKDNLDEDL
tara:strand:+ start:60 stop:509 length:450 start_codon:yes stop_codon:yes gene_type:complete